MSNHWDYTGFQNIEIKDEVGMRTLKNNSTWGSLIQWDMSGCIYELGHKNEDYFINYFDPSEPDVEEFLTELGKVSEDFNILVFDHYARYEGRQTWYKLVNTNGVLKIINMELVEVKE